MADEAVSHGRGGAGNINQDDTPYTDGNIVREGPLGDQGDGAYSAGVRPTRLFSPIPSSLHHTSHFRPPTLPTHPHPSSDPKTNTPRPATQRGGAGNIESPRVKPTDPTKRGDADVVPETAMLETGSDYDKYHVGRGGEGNVHRDAGVQTHKGLADKLKDKMFKKGEK